MKQFLRFVIQEMKDNYDRSKTRFWACVDARAELFITKCFAETRKYRVASNAKIREDAAN